MNPHRVRLHDGFTVETDCASFAGFLRRTYSARLPLEVRDSADAAQKVQVTVSRHPGWDGRTDFGSPGLGERVLVQRDPVLTQFQRVGLRRRSAGGVVQTVIPASRTVVEYRAAGVPVAVQSPCRGAPVSMISAYQQDDAFRTVRHVLYSHLLRRGYVWCHAACVASERGALLIVGASRAGKTSTMTHLLRSGRYGFLSNSRSFIRGSGSRIQVEGLPELVQLRQGFLRDNPDVATRLGVRQPALLADAWQAPEATKQPVFCTDFALALGVRERYRAQVQGLVIPVLDRGATGTKPSLSDDGVRAIIDENLLVGQYLTEYTWYEGAEPSAPHTERTAAGQTLALLPRQVAYFDRDARIVVASAAG